MAGTIGESERNSERTKRRGALYEARKEFEAIESRILREAGPEGFYAKKRELALLRDEYQSLPVKEKSEIDGLHATAEVRQKQKFLERYFIDSAIISGVGLARKAALRSFGIETAADVDWHKVRAVQGFGEVLTRAVVDWKKSCERRFVFNPHNAVSEADKNAVRAKIATRKRTIEAALSNGALELQRYRQAISTKSTELLPLLNTAARKLAQTQADLNLL
jgi:DNA-binding helix-hairpin-helix protein with protein kinase domain